MKTIHFICTGNVYRSRLAEAYFNSLHIPNIKIISSGIEADHSGDGPIEWYAMRLLYNANLESFMAYDCQKTTVDLLKKGDFTVFMEPKHLDFCSNVLGYLPEFYQVWNVEDMHPRDLTDRDIIDISEKTFSLIKTKVEALIKDLTK